MSKVGHSTDDASCQTSNPKASTPVGLHNQPPTSTPPAYPIPLESQSQPQPPSALPTNDPLNPHHGVSHPRHRGPTHPRPRPRHPSQSTPYPPPLPPPQANRAKQFKKLLAPGKIGQTLCLGNLTDKHTYEYLRSITPDLKIVKGRNDVEATSLPLTQVVTHGSIRIGFLEGFTLVSSEPDLLLAEANRLDVDVLCWGGTHKFDAFEYMDKFFVNPGSATGAFLNSWGGVGEDPTPSFCLMDVSLIRAWCRYGGLWVADVLCRFKGFLLPCTSINFVKTTRGMRMWLWRKSRIRNQSRQRAIHRDELTA